jgi:hypothetical protein
LEEKMDTELMEERRIIQKPLASARGLKQDEIVRYLSRLLPGFGYDDICEIKYHGRERNIAAARKHVNLVWPGYDIIYLVWKEDGRISHKEIMDEDYARLEDIAQNDGHIEVSASVSNRLRLETSRKQVRIKMPFYF